MCECFEKRIFKYIEIPVAIIGCLIVSNCIPNSKYEKNTETHQEIVNQPIMTNSPNRNVGPDQDRSIKSSRIVYKNISDLGRKAGLLPIQHKKLVDSEMEFRLWGDIGLDEEKVVVIEISDNKWKASLITVKHEEKTHRRHSRNLLSPKSGWEELDRFLKLNRVVFPLPFSFDSPDLPPIVDEGVVFLEFNHGGNYDFIYYGQSTESSDGKAVLSICRKIEDEFQVNMGCSVRSVQ